MLILPIYSQQAEVLLFCELKISAINVLHNFQLPRLNTWEILVFSNAVLTSRSVDR